MITDKKIHALQKQKSKIEIEKMDSSQKISEIDEKIAKEYFGKMTYEEVEKLWNKDTNKGGVFQLYCINTLIIGKQGVITTDNSIYNESGIGTGHKVKGDDGKWYYSGGSYGGKGCIDSILGIAKPPKIYGNKDINPLQFGSSSSFSSDKK